MTRDDICLYDKQHDFIESELPLLAFVGGIGSGKTFSGAHFACKMLNDHPERIGLIASNTHKQLHSSTIPAFSEILEAYGWFENKHYVVNKNPAPFFGYDSKFKEHSGIWSFYHGAQILTFSLESMMRGISVAWAWIDESQDAKKKDLDIVVGRVREAKPLIRYTMTPPQNNPDINDMIFGDDAIPVIHATTYDNEANLPPEYIPLLKSTYDKLTFQREVMGEEATNASNRFMYSFIKAKHVADELSFEPRQTVYMSFDFNISPMAVIVWQQGRDYIHYLDEFTIDDANVYKMCEAIRDSRYWGCHLLVTGDSTSDKRDINQRDNTINSWTIVKDELELRKEQIKIVNNPDTDDVQKLCNCILENYPDIRFDKRMKLTIRDCQFVKVDNRNKIIKANRRDPTQRADHLDCLKYSLNTFHFDFVDKVRLMKQRQQRESKRQPIGA